MYGYDIFHENILNELIESVRRGENRQAYLFCGPEGIGRKNAAELFAASLVCGNKEAAPCNSCQACIGAKSKTNPDIIYIRPTDKKSISAEQARSIVADAYIRPFESSKKVYIVEDASLLNEFAQNCLLKILEEPPEYIVFIIITTSEAYLLQTVLSRCTVIRFPSLSNEKIKEYIEKKYPSQISRAGLLANISQGNPGTIDKIISDPEFDLIRSSSFRNLSSLLSSDKLISYDICSFIEENKDKADMIFGFWESFLRDMMVIRNCGRTNIINSDMQEEIKNLAYSYDEKAPIIALEQIILASEMLHRYVNLHILSLKLSFSIKNKLYTK